MASGQIRMTPEPMRPRASDMTKDFVSDISHSLTLHTVKTMGFLARDL